MVVSTITYSLGANTFNITKFPATKGFVLKLKLISILGPLLSSLEGVRDIDDKMSFDTIGKIIERILTVLPPEKFVELVLELMSNTSITTAGGRSSSINATEFDVIFCDNYGDMYKLLTFIVKENWKSFFAMLPTSTVGKVQKILTSTQDSSNKLPEDSINP
jgi:hypothetical protein